MGKIDIVDRSLSSFRVGERASLVREITGEDIALFASLSGDRNQLHTDESYAATTPHEKPIAHGLLVAAPISTLAGHLLPGKRCLLLEVRSRFIRPVFPGDKLTYRGVITQISPAIRVLVVEVEVTNQEGAVVLRGRYTGKMLADPTDEENL